MKDIDKLTTSEKIVILDYIKKNYHEFRETWHHSKVAYLENSICYDLEDLSKFNPLSPYKT